MDEVDSAADGSPEVPSDARTHRTATIYDIAKLAGVNPSTVSRALTKPGRISAKTEERVRDAASRLNYHANPMARALPTGRTGLIGLIVADITNPMFFDLVRGVERAAGGEGYTLLLAETEESAHNELRSAERLLRVADGLMLVSSRLKDSEILALAATKPIVIVNRAVPGVPSVLVDVDYGIGEGLRHLAGLGHRSIAYLAGPERSWMSEHRWECIQRRSEWANVSAHRINVGSPTVDGGRSAATQVRASEATAVMAFNDLMAIGLMQELLLAGATVPGDYSIIGFDNIFGSDFTTPPLTTIASPLSEVGAQAFATVIGGDERSTEDQSTLTSRLIVRGSTGLARTAARR